MQNNFKKAVEATDLAIEWIKRNAVDEKKIDEIKEKLITKVCRTCNSSASASEVLTARTTIGIFGASQAGKSYLVSNIAAANGSLETKWEGYDIDFIDHVNPNGGDKEATGVVTRFTHRENTGAPGFPIEIRVMKEVEIALCMVNSYFNDLSITRNENPFDSELENYKSHIEKCLKDYKSSEPVHVTASDIVFMADYIKSHSKGILTKLDADSEFWVMMRNTAPQLTLEGRTELFSILWGKLNAYSEMFKKIAQEINKLKGADLVYASLGAFVKTEPKLQQLDLTINNVRALDNIFDDEKTLSVTLDKNATEKVDVIFSCFAAASLEILFPLLNKCDVDEFDVLDFPGARSRESYEQDKLTGSQADMKDTGGQLLRRGKIAYLFDRYNSRREIDVLLFCINSAAQLEVSELVPLISEWVETNVGNTPNERAKAKNNPLIGVLTRFDEAVSKDLKSINTTGLSVANKIISDALKKFIDKPWLNEWAPGKHHDQFFLVKKTAMEGNDRWLKVDFDNKKEIEIVPEMLGEIENFKSNIMADPLSKHLYGNKTAVDEVFRLNDGGVTYLTRFLLQQFSHSDPNEQDDSKVRLSRDVITEVKSIYNDLKKYSTSTDLDEKLNDSIVFANELLQCDKTAETMTRIRELLELNSDNLTRLYRDEASAGNNAERFSSEVMELWLKNLDEISKGKKFTTLFYELWTAWESIRKNVERQSDADTEYSFFYDSKEKDFIKTEGTLKDKFSQLIMQFTGEIKKAAFSQKINLKQRIIDSIYDEEEQGLKKELLAPGQTRRVQSVLSDFNTYLTFAFSDLKKDIADRFGRADFTPFFDRYDISLGLPKITVDMVHDASMKFKKDYLSALIDLMVNVNINAESEYNVSGAENLKLSEILKLYKDSVKTEDA